MQAEFLSKTKQLAVHESTTYIDYIFYQSITMNCPEGRTLDPEVPILVNY
jgi:hypothetical protein